MLYSEEVRSSVTYDQFQNLQFEAEPYRVPPDLNQLEDFEDATSAGYVVDPTRGREPFSLQFLDNHRFPITVSSDKFSQMSIGYTLPFLYSKFSIAFSIVPFLLYAIVAAILYVTSDGCLGDSALNALVADVKSVADIDAIRPRLPESPIPDRLTMIYNNPDTDPTFKKYQSLNCLFLSLSKTDKCKVLDNLQCSNKNYGDACEKANVEAYLETYIDGLCRLNFVSMFSAGNFLYEEGGKRIALYVVQAVSVVIGLMMVSLFTYFHERKVRKYALHNSTIENFSVLLLGLNGFTNADLGDQIMRVFKQHAMTVASVNFLFDVKNYVRLQKKANLTRRNRSKQAYKAGLVGFEDAEGRLSVFEAPPGDLPGISKRFDRKTTYAEMVGRRTQNPNLIAEQRLSIIGSQPLNETMGEDTINDTFRDPAVFGSFMEEVDFSVKRDLAQKNRTKFESYQIRLTDIEAQIMEDTKSYMQGPASKYFLGAAIVSLETEEEKIKALSVFERRGWLYKTLGFGPIHTRIELIMNDGVLSHQLWLEKCYAPQDIIWEHLGYSNFERFARRIAALALSILLIALIFIVILAIKFGGLAITGGINKRSNNDDGPWVGYGANGLIALIIIIIDYLLQYLFLKISRFERNVTITVTERNVTRKIWLMQFVASGLIPAVVAILLLNWYGPDGMLYTIHLIFLSNLVLTPLFIVFGDFIWYYKKYKQHRIKKFIRTGQGKLATQEEANEVWLKFKFNLAFVYSLMLKNLALAAFYATIFPIGVVYCVAQMIIYYWCFKWILVNISNKLPSYSEKISRDLLTDLEWILLIFVLGMAYEDIIRQLILIRPFNIPTLHIVLFAVIVVISYFEVKELSTDFLREKKLSASSFYQIKQADPNSYHLANPAAIKSLRRTNKQTNLPANQMSISVLPNKDLSEIKRLQKAMPLVQEKDDMIYTSSMNERVSLKL